MRVTWIIRPTVGGIRQHLTQLLTGLDKHYNISICGPYELKDWINFQGYQYYPIDIVDGIVLKKDIKAIGQLYKVFQTTRPQLVHIHGLKSVSLTVPAAKLSGVRRLLFTAHNCLPKPHTKWYQITHGFFNRRLLKALNRTIAVSDEVEQEYLQFLAPERVVTIRNGVDWHRFADLKRLESREKLAIKPNSFVVGVVARLIPEKGLTTLLQAAAIIKNILPNVRFVVVGDGPMQVQLENYSTVLALDSIVNFLGYRSDIPLLMTSWDLFVLPSQSEGFSVSVLEAMAAKLPVVVSDLPSMREMVVPSKSGLLFEVGNAPELAAAIIQLAKDRDKCKAMGEYNFRRVKSLFSNEQMIKATKLQYQELLDERKSW